MRSERCGVIAPKLNLHRVFFSVPKQHIQFSIVSFQCERHIKHLTLTKSACSPGGGFPRLDTTVSFSAGMCPIMPRPHFGHNTGLYALYVGVLSQTTIIRINPPFRCRSQLYAFCVQLGKKRGCIKRRSPVLCLRLPSVFPNESAPLYLIR